MGGAAAGAAIGAIGGPLGMLIGGAIGAIAGGVAGHAAGEAIDPTVEDAYWNDTYSRTTYYKEGYDYTNDYRPAYAVGYANRAKYPAGTTFDSVESDLERSWQEVKVIHVLHGKMQKKRFVMVGIEQMLVFLVKNIHHVYVR